MAENTTIEWADHSFNPWTGCTKISPACDNCYAEGWSKRSGHVKWGPHGDRRRTTAATWAKPVKLNAALQGTGRKEMVFCASLADVCDNHKSIEPDWRKDLRELIRTTPNLIWLLLTKRPQNIQRFILGDRTEVYPNVWLGTTVENNDEARRRLPHLLEIPAPVHFVSAEPLLGEVDLRRWLMPAGSRWGLNWVITGGESGPGSRRTHPDHFRSLRDQCAEKKVPFFFKQWGDWAVVDGPMHGDLTAGEWFENHVGKHGGEFLAGRGPGITPDIVRKVGKKKAGRRLDGVLHHEFPA